MATLSLPTSSFAEKRAAAAAVAEAVPAAPSTERTTVETAPTVQPVVTPIANPTSTPAPTSAAGRLKDLRVAGSCEIFTKISSQTTKSVNTRSGQMTDLFAEDLNTVIRQHSEALAKQLHAQRESLFPPDATKQMRKFTSGEAAALLGINDSYLRKLHLDGKGPSPETTAGNRRLYSAQDLHELRELLEKTARKPGDYLPGRREGDHLQVIGVMNFKGGSGKTTTAAHLAQRLALTGYRVLAIDLDPQASMTALHGVQPEFDLPDGGTLYDAIRYDDPAPIQSVIRKTYIPGLDLIPGNLELMEFEHDTPRAPAQGNAGLLFFRVPDALTKVDGNYDVAVIDCPPQLGFLSMSALSAATRVLVTIYPEMLDVMSMSQFLRMTANLMDVITDSGADMSHDWTRYLLTRY